MIDIPLPGREQFATVADQASLTELSPDEAVSAARTTYPGLVGERPFARFLMIEDRSTNNAYPPEPRWVILSPGIFVPMTGPLDAPPVRFVESYAWVFLDSRGTAIGATVVSYRAEEEAAAERARSGAL